MQSASVTPAERPERANPFVQAASPAERVFEASEPKPVAQVNSPPAHVDHSSSTEPSPVPPSVHESAAYVSPVPPSVRSSGYVAPAAPPEDVNPIVRPVPGYVSPVPPRVAELRTEHAVPPPSPVAEPVHATPEAPVVELAPTKAPEPSADHAPAAVELPTVIVSPEIPAPTAVPDVPNVEAQPHDSLVQPRPLELPVVAEPVLEQRAAAAPVIEAPVPASAFETAPTEFAATETPIASTHAEAAADDAHAASTFSAEPALSGEAPIPGVAAAAFASDLASAPSNPESVVVESEIQEQAAVPAPFPAPRSFTSSGSEMPVVITTPQPHHRDSGASSAKLFGLGRELLPKAEAWSRKTLRATPRALVITAPFIALFGIWAVRSLVSHSKPAPVAEANSNVVANVAAATPAPQSTEKANAAPATSAILVSTSAAPAAAPPVAEPAELSAAVSHGLPALEALSHKFPSDPQVAIALASQQAQAQRFEAAVASVEHAIATDPKSAQSGKVMGILWRAAQSGASEPTFTALRKLGAKGSDVAFDLATTAGVRDSVRDRAKIELKSLPADASADTSVATALLLASDCGARKALLPRAEKEGAKRTQKMLELYSRGAACTSTTDKDCNSCLTGSPELAHTLAQLSAGDGK